MSPLEHKTGNQCEDILKFKQEFTDVRKRIDRLEDRDQNHANDIRSLFAAHEGTKAYVTQILTRFDSLETKLFTWVKDITKQQAEERKAEIESELRKAKLASTERTTAHKLWIDYSKYIIGATLGAMVYYLLTTGGKITQ